MIDINELRRLTQAATPGPWMIDYVGVGFEVAAGESVIAQSQQIRGDMRHKARKANAAFIAAANPAVMIELLDRLEAAEKERDELRAEVIHIKEVEFPRKAQAVADGWRGKCERLEAKIAEMERQEPVAEWLPLDSGEDTRRD